MRKKRNLLAAVGLIALLVGGLLMLGRQGPGVDGRSEDLVRSGASPDVENGVPPVKAKARPGERGIPGSLVLVVKDGEGERIPGLELTVASKSGTTDHQGELRLDGLEPGLWSVHVPDGWIAMPTPSEGDGTPRELEVTPGVQTETIIVIEDCTGPFRVLTPDGEPLVGAKVVNVNGASEGLVGPSGETPPIRRACGEGTVWIWVDGKVRYLNLPVTIPGPRLVDIPLPANQDAEILLVDDEGQPLEAKIRGQDLHEAEALGAGLYRVTGPVDVLSVGIVVEDFATRRVHVPLDGGRHEVVMRSRRRVQVRSVCEDPCQVELSCGGQACASVSDGFDCDCPSLPTTLDAAGVPCEPTSPTRKLVGGMEDLVIDWDLRCGSGSVHGRWAGRTPCSARVSSVRVDDGTCGSDGTFEVREIPPGRYTLVVNDHQPGRFQTRSAAQQASRTFELAPGQRLDLGVLEPDAGCIQGKVECDQPLDEVYVESTSQQVQTKLDDEGAFMLCGLPPDEVIELDLWSQDLGYTSTESRAGEILHWRVRSGLDGLENLELRRERE